MPSVLRGSCDFSLWLSLLAGHWFCWSILFQAAATNMDFLFICPFLLALLLSRGSFADLEKQRMDSGLEICILLCSLPLVSRVCAR